MMSRHYHDPAYVPMFDVDNIALSFTGVRHAGGSSFRGRQRGLAGRPVQDGADARSTTPTRRRPAQVGPDGIGNGLYSIHIRMLDGIDAGNTGVMMLHDGSIRGRRRVLRLYRGVHGGERQMEGRTRQPRAYGGKRRTGRCSAAMKSASAFPARTTARARKAKPPRSPASAASASRRCCESWWMLRIKPSRSPAAARR